MTLTQLLVSLSDDVTINVTKDNEIIASFLKSTYSSIDSTILAYTVSTISISIGAGAVKSIEVTVTEA